MKKVLLTSSALVAFAGAAAAEVSLSGYAEMGLRGGSDVDTQFHHDIDVKFSLSGETDGGVSFGATIDLDEVSNGISNDANPSSVYISGGFGTLTMGDTDGAFDKALTEVGSLSAIADDHTSHAGYNGNSGLDGSGDGQVLRYDYAFDAFTLSVSAEQILESAGSTTKVIDQDSTSATYGTIIDKTTDPVAADTILGLGAAWSSDIAGMNLGLGFGYQTSDAGDVMGLSVATTLESGLGVVLNYSTMDADKAGDEGDWDHMAIGLSYSMDALSLHANYGVKSYAEAGVEDSDGFGLAVNYDLGGGAVVMAGYGSTMGADSVDTWSLGLGLSF